MEKTVIIINGAGGTGKDTICNIVAEHFKTEVISSVDVIKKIAAYGGWNYSDKSNSARKLLSDLKQAFTDYNDLPTNYLMQEYEKFMNSTSTILFVHIREPKEIEKFKNKINARCFTLLIKSDKILPGNYGNHSDDCVNDYNYDLEYLNEFGDKHIELHFMSFFYKNVVN